MILVLVDASNFPILAKEATTTDTTGKELASTGVEFLETSKSFSPESRIDA
jgi:hypothetical protein